MYIYIYIYLNIKSQGPRLTWKIKILETKTCCTEQEVRSNLSMPPPKQVSIGKRHVI